MIEAKPFYVIERDNQFYRWGAELGAQWTTNFSEAERITHYKTAEALAVTYGAAIWTKVSEMNENSHLQALINATRGTPLSNAETYGEDTATMMRNPASIVAQSLVRLYARIAPCAQCDPQEGK